MLCHHINAGFPFLLLTVIFHHAASDNIKHLRQTNKIIGGDEAEAGRYPYQAIVIGDGFCGGTLINSRWVLSAAHCFGSRYVEIGRSDRSKNCKLYEKIQVEYEVLHPDYDPITIDNDIMLIKLKRPSIHQPIKLDDGTSRFPEGMKVTVTGFGVTDPDHQHVSRILREAEVSLVANDKCGESYDSVNLPITESMLCASEPDKDSCKGDSGGPLFIKGKDASEDRQIGIVSWGIGCARPDFPGVYASVNAGMSFIEDVMQCKKPDNLDLDGCCQVSCVNGVYSCGSTCCFPNDGFDYSGCNVENPCWIGDGKSHDGEYNTVECNFDGGDWLFPSTDGFDYYSCNVENPAFIGNGFCDDDAYNNAECNYDGGDCCKNSIFGSENCIDPIYQRSQNGQTWDFVKSIVHKLSDKEDILMKFFQNK